jgi:hypothetical protein
MLVFWANLGCNKEVRMSRKSYTVEQIIGMLREVEVELSRGQKLGQLCRNLGITEQTSYGWRQEYNTVRSHSSLCYRPPAPETI